MSCQGRVVQGRTEQSRAVQDRAGQARVWPDREGREPVLTAVKRGGQGSGTGSRHGGRHGDPVLDAAHGPALRSAATERSGQRPLCVPPPEPSRADMNHSRQTAPDIINSGACTQTDDVISRAAGDIGQSDLVFHTHRASESLHGAPALKCERAVPNAMRVSIFLGRRKPESYIVEVRVGI